MSATFIKAAEVWIPSADGTLLEFGAGAYGAVPALAAVSRAMCFGRGEGLPGRAWDEGRPLLLRQFEGSYFRRTAAAQAAGLTCAIALPLFVRDALTSVLVLFCGHLPDQAAGLELWHQDPRVTSDMVLVDGAYGPDGADFEALSRDTFLPRGVGLPGLAWQRGEVVYLSALTAEPRRFLRAQLAADIGMMTGLAIPVGSRLDDRHAVCVLSGPRLPLARCIERWVPSADGQSLQGQLVAGEAAAAPPGGADLPLLPGLAEAGHPIVSAWLRGVPAIVAPPASAGDAGATVVAIPVLRDGAVSEVLVLCL